MLRAAMDFCAADVDVQRRTMLLRKLRALHSGTHVCYLPVKNEFGESSSVRFHPRSGADIASGSRLMSWTILTLSGDAEPQRHA